MNHKYVYCFTLRGTGIAHSFETAESLRRRVKTASDKEQIEGLIKNNISGHFVSLESGALVFQQ